MWPNPETAGNDICCRSLKVFVYGNILMVSKYLAYNQVYAQIKHSVLCLVTNESSCSRIRVSVSVLVSVEQSWYIDTIYTYQTTKHKKAYEQWFGIILFPLLINIDLHFTRCHISLYICAFCLTISQLLYVGMQVMAQQLLLHWSRYIQFCKHGHYINFKRYRFRYLKCVILNQVLFIAHAQYYTQT